MTEDDKLAEALRPFVDHFMARRDAYIRRYGNNPLIGANNFDAMPDTWDMENCRFTMGHYRRARQALREYERTRNGQ